MGIREILKDVSDTYVDAKREPFTQHPVAYYLRNEAPATVADILGGTYFEVTGSPGQGRWAEVPWISISDPNVSTSATNGQYIVYLFSADMARVYLTLGQGTTIIRQEFGNGTHAELQRRAALIRARVPEHLPKFSTREVDLGGTTPLARDYAPGVAFGVVYDSRELPVEEMLVQDLKQIVGLYTRLNARGGVDTFDVPPVVDSAGDEPTSIVERRRYRLHRKLDRHSRAAKRAKEVHGYFCQGCDLDFESVYGAIGRNYIEAHHLTPLSELPEDVPVQQDAKTDFAVLCANCHRMMHRPESPNSVEGLRRLHGVSQLRDYFKRR